MIDAAEWDWIVEHAHGSFDHLILATTLPVFAPVGIHYLESWNEAVCDGIWGSFAARLGERLRRAVDLEHWSAFQQSFEQFVDLLRAIGNGLGGEPPATITILSGDVHTTYVAEVDLGAHAGPSSVYQIVCSRLSARVFSVLSRICNVPPPTAKWAYIAHRTFDNSIGELELAQRAAVVTLSRAITGPEREPTLERIYTRELAGETREVRPTVGGAESK
jgi:hypothetical protein